MSEFSCFTLIFKLFFAPLFSFFTSEYQAQGTHTHSTPNIQFFTSTLYTSEPKTEFGHVCLYLYNEMPELVVHIVSGLLGSSFCSVCYKLVDQKEVFLSSPPQSI